MIELKDTIAGMTSADYKERFKAEFYQAYIRLKKLEKLVEDFKADVLDFIPDCPIQLLQEQMWVMQTYVNVMLQRALVEEINVMEGLF